MNRGFRRLLTGLALFAVFTAAVDCFGWWWWNSAAGRLSIDAEGGARILAESGPLGVPSAVERSRRLAVSELGSAPTDLIYEVLTRLSSLQIQWMPSHAVGFVNRARFHLLAGDLETALPALEGAVLRDPTSPYLRRLRALGFLALGKTTNATDDLAIAEAIAPGMRTPLVDIPPENEALVRVRGLEIRGDYYPRRRPETALMLAREYRKQGFPDRAMAALSEYPHHPDILLEKAQWAIREGDVGSAAVLLEEVTESRTVSRRHRARAWSALAVVRATEGDHEAAHSAAQQALAIDPNSPPAYVSLAGLAERRGEYDLALEHLRRAWGMDPSNTSLLVQIARVAEQAGRQPDAVLALERAVEVDPTNPDLAARLVTLQLRVGAYSEAAVSLSRALDRNPTDPRLLDLTDRLRREVGIR